MNGFSMSCSSPIRAVTFDAYNTLFDFAGNALPTLRAILPEEVHERLDTVWDTMNGVVIRLFREFVGHRREDFPRFLTLADVHRACFAEVRTCLLPTLDVDAATEAWNRYIARVPLFDDARPAVEWAAARFPTAIVSDIDTWMLLENPALASLPFSAIVTSEDDRSYKAMADSTMFQRASKLLGCPPENLVHVGDSSSDVAGAKRVGAHAIWLNRNGRRPPDDMPAPDGELRTLAELPALLSTLISEGR